MFVRRNTAWGNTTSAVYTMFSFGLDSMLGRWISHSGGTCPKAGLESGILIIEKGKMLFVVLMM